MRILASKKMKDTIINIFVQVKDPRKGHLIDYPLIEILFLVFCAVSCKYFTWEEIEVYGNIKLEWLRKFMPYKNGIPSHDTINRTMSLLSPRALESCLINWRKMKITLPNKDVINIDGKKIRRSVTSKQQQTKKVDGGKQCVQMLHAWSSALNVCLAQRKIESKNNEITDLPAILDMLEIEGCIITSDCINCQKSTTEYITDRGADYVIGLKGNQETFLKVVEKAFEIEQIPTKDQVSTKEKSHGRLEERISEVLPSECLVKYGYKDLEMWKGLKTIIRTKSIRKEPTKAETIEYRYHISSLEANAESLYKIIRGHWAVENQLHWKLDVCMNEDTSRKRVENSAENFSCIRKLVMNCLNTCNFESLGLKKKMSLPSKMAACALSDTVREVCLGICNSTT